MALAKATAARRRGDDGRGTRVLSPDIFRGRLNDLDGKMRRGLLDCGSRRQSDIATTGNQNIQHHQNPFMHPGTCARNR